MSTHLKSNSTSRWPHRIAVVLASVVFPLIWVGGLVTTYDAGMAVPDWPGTYGYNMFLYPLETWLWGPFDLLVEHGHRLLGSLAGLIAIALVIACFRFESRRWVRHCSIGLLVLVILQGSLGGMRVLMDARLLAKIHGCVGPAFFASVVAFCVVTSRWWRQVSENPLPGARAPRWFASSASLLLLVSFLQLAIGAMLRHVAFDTPPNIYRGLVILHVSTAILLVLGTWSHWLLLLRSAWRSIGLAFSSNLLACLLTLQFLLGVGTWVVKFGWPTWFESWQTAASFVVGEKTLFQMNLITAHVAVGSLILAFWTIQSVRSWRLTQASSTEESPDPVRQTLSPAIPAPTETAMESA